MRNKEENRSKNISSKATTPHKIRKDWLMVQLGDVCEFVRGPFGGSLKKEIFVNDGYAVYEQSHAIYSDFSQFRYFINKKKFNEMKRFEIQSDDLIMSCSGTIGKTAIIPQKHKEGIINQALLKITTKKYLHIFFLKLFMDSIHFKSQLSSKGGAIQNISSVKVLRQIKFPLTPLSEQKAIVQKIENVFKLIDSSEKELKSAKEKLKVYRQAVLKKVFDGKLLSKKELDICKKKKEWKPVNKLLNDINLKATTSLHKTRKDWLMVQLGDVLEIMRGGSPRPIKKYITTHSNGINWIKIGDIGKNEKYITKTEKKIKSEGLSKTRVVKKGDFILSNSMSFGRPYILKIDGAIHDGWLLLKKKNKKSISSDFLYQTLKSNYSQAQYKKLAVGGVVRNLKIDTVKSIQIPLAPLPEQKAIVQKIESIFSHCDKLSSEIEQNLKNIKLLRQSVLRKAFSGTFLNKKELETCKKISAMEVC